MGDSSDSDSGSEGAEDQETLAEVSVRIVVALTERCSSILFALLMCIQTLLIIGSVTRIHTCMCMTGGCRGCNRSCGRVLWHHQLQL